MDERLHRGGLVWPVILIGAGVVFLLNNLGVVGWNVWGTLWRLWPVLLIAAGLDILIGRRSLLGSALVALLLVVVLGLAIGLGLPQWGNSDAASAARTEPISEDLKGAARADVAIGFGAGTLRLAALPEGSAQLLKGTADLSKGENLQLSHTGSSAVDRLDLRSQNGWTVGPNVIADDRKAWDLELNRDIPMSLQVDVGVGRSTLDLTQLNLTRLVIDGGVGQATVKLPMRGRFDVEIDGGVGEITLIISQGLAARVRVDGGLGGVSVDGNFNRRDREYTSPNYSSAENRANIQVDGGVGRIVIREVAE